jgi:hypothetical protein
MSRSRKTSAACRQRSRRAWPALPVALAVAAALALGSTANGAADGTSAASGNSRAAATTATATKIRIRIGTRTLTATVARNATARDFVSLLPLSLRMRDLSGRGKTAALPRALAKAGTARYTFSAGAIAYRPRGREVVVYDRRGADVPQPGIVLLARLDSNARAFSVAGTVRVRIERVPTTQPASPLPRVIVGTTVRFSSNSTSVDVRIGQDNPAVRDFLSMLPLTLTVQEFTGREKISYLPRRLRHNGSPGSDPKNGDLIYFVPWGNLGFYYNAEGIGYSDATIHLGTYDASLDQLERLEGRVTVRVIAR